MVDRQISDAALDILFRKARSHGVFEPDSVSDAQLHAIYEIMKHGPTTANSQPQRIMFLRSQEAKGPPPRCRRSIARRRSPLRLRRSSPMT